jgi:REP element-mobilizing transposase RayT
MRSNNNVTFDCKYHVVWCPKYRRDVLVHGVDVRLKQIVGEEVVVQKQQIGDRVIDWDCEGQVVFSAADVNPGGKNCWRIRPE